MIDGNLHSVFKANVPEAFWQKIETGGVGLGVPDSHYLLNGKAGWIEFKVTSAFSVGLSPEQVGWADRYHRNGGRILIAVRRKTLLGPRRGPPTDGLWLYQGQYVKELATDGLKCGHHALHCPGPSKQWRWDVIKALL